MAHSTPSHIPAQKQNPPGYVADMSPAPDHGEHSYIGSGKLKGKVALITGADSGIGRAVAIAFAREGANIVISYLNEHEDAENTAYWVKEAGVDYLKIAGDIVNKDHCIKLVEGTVQKFGKIDIIVNNAAFQRSYDSIEDISSDEWDKTFKTNIYAPFFICQAAVPYLDPGATIINTASIQSKKPSGSLLAYATTKGAILNFTTGLAEMLADKGVRVNAVAPGPIWTPLIPSTLPEKKRWKISVSKPPWDEWGNLQNWPGLMCFLLQRVPAI
jgi:NAD(P)-dependent dehydrogenase (short-subunit alcohol dehydrogenase family)